MKLDRTTGAITAAGAVLVLLFAVVTMGRSPQEQPTSPNLALANPEQTYNPVSAGEDLPDGFRQLLGRDQIAPIYDPQFTTASRVDWPREMLVIGVAGEHTAKAYPVTPLNGREMVIDSLEGIPILVTW